MPKYIMVVLLALGGTAWGAPELDPLTPREEGSRSGVPFYVPRAVFAGTFFNNSAVTPQVRVTWEAAPVQTKRDALLLLFEVGGGYGAWMPRSFGSAGDDAMTFFYQHTLLLGLGYQARYPGGFSWGFHVGTGPLFYGARIENAPRENVVAGWVEGRVQAGWRLGDVTYGLSFGYANLYDPPRRIQSGSFVGGPMLGLYADWR